MLVTLEARYAPTLVTIRINTVLILLRKGRPYSFEALFYYYSHFRIIFRTEAFISFVKEN